MKLEDCKVGMKVWLSHGLIHNTGRSVKDVYPDMVGIINRMAPTLQAPVLIMPGDWWFSSDQLEPYIEPEETKYRQLKDITPKAIFEKAWANGGWLGGLTNDFMQEFTRFIMTFSLLYDEVVSFEDVVNELEVEPEWEKWLIQHGFIEKVAEEVTYAVGDELVNDKGEKALLAQVDTGKVSIIMTEGWDKGNRWHHPTVVDTTSKITAKEFAQTNIGATTGTWRKEK